MKKLLYLPLLVPGGANEQLDLLAAFNKRFNTKMLDHVNETGAYKKLLELVENWRPDIVHCQFSDNIGVKLVKKLKEKYPKIIWTQWTGDARDYPIPYIVKFGRVVDATLLATGKGQKTMYEKETGKPVFWWQHAVANWQLVELLPEVYREGIVMVGNNYGEFPGSKERIELAELLTEEFEDFIAYGDGYPETVRRGGKIPWRDQTKVYQKAKITIGTNAYNDIEWYFSDRPLIAMAAGTCHLFRYVPGAKKLFDDYRDCVFWETPREATERIRKLLKDSEGRETIAKNGQKNVKKYHTWDCRVKTYEEIIIPAVESSRRSK